MHPYGCGNALLESAGNAVGRLVHLHLAKETNLACYVVRDDGTDGCRVCFTAQEYATGTNALKIRNGGNIVPLAVTVAARVTRFVSVVKAHALIFFVPLMSSILFEWNEKGMGVLSILIMLLKF
jgi:hypothetical protein